MILSLKFLTFVWSLLAAGLPLSVGAQTKATATFSPLVDLNIQAIETKLGQSKIMDTPWNLEEQGIVLTNQGHKSGPSTLVTDKGAKASAKGDQAPLQDTGQATGQATGLASGQDLNLSKANDRQRLNVNGLSIGQALSLEAINVTNEMVSPEKTAAIAPADSNPDRSDPAPDPNTTERIALARQLLAIDGSEDTIRSYIATEHMKLIIGEVNKYININNLSDTDRYRLSIIANTAALDLGDRILDMNARLHAFHLTRNELMLLIKDLDIPAQKKLTRIRLEDNGRLDKRAELELQLAQLQIIKAFQNTP
jgi:hypothetical protein